MQNKSILFSLLKIIILVPLGLILGAFIGWLIAIIGGVTLGLIEGLGYITSGTPSRILYQTVTMGIIWGGVLGIIYALFCGGVIGASVTIQSLLLGVKSVVKVHSILIYIFSIIVIIGAEYWIFENTALLVNQKDARNVVDRFGQALVEKTPGRAKALANPGLWKEIEFWMDGQEGFECPRILLFENGQYQNQIEIENDISFFYGCYVKGEDYELNIERVRLERIKGKWQVTGWDRICETWGRKNIHRCSR